MKITNTFKHLSLLALFSIIISCSDNEEITPTDNLQESITAEEINEVYLFDDPNFVSENNNKNNTDLARSGTVKVGLVSAHLNKEINATGKIYYKIRRLRDDYLVAQTGKVDVKKLETHESGKTKYTIVNYPLNKYLEIGEVYRLEVICHDCSTGTDKNVNWWKSEQNDYNFGFAVNNNWENDVNFDFSFKVQNKRDDGSLYNSQYNFKRKVAYALGYNQSKAAQTFIPSDEFPCDIFNDLSALDIIPIRVNEGTSDRQVKFKIKNNSDKDIYFGDLDIIDYTAEDFEVDANGKDRYVNVQYIISTVLWNYAVDDQVRSSKTIKANQTAEFLTLPFNSNGKKYYYGYITNRRDFLNPDCYIQFGQKINKL